MVLGDRPCQRVAYHGGGLPPVHLCRSCSLGDDNLLPADNICPPHLSPLPTFLPLQSPPSPWRVCRAPPLPPVTYPPNPTHGFIKCSSSKAVLPPQCNQPQSHRCQPFFHPRQHSHVFRHSFRHHPIVVAVAIAFGGGSGSVRAEFLV